MKRRNYTPEETKALAAAYVRMAVHEFNGESYSKAHIVRGLLHTMPHRTRGAIEAKFMNLSAVAYKLDLFPQLAYGYVKGYKPAPNGAKALKDALIVETFRNPAAHAICELEHVTLEGDAA